jgi:hypothetical protein
MSEAKYKETSYLNTKTFIMQHFVLVLAIMFLICIVPKRYNEKAEEKVTLMLKVQKMQEKETIKPEADDYSDNDFSIYCSVVDISGL